MKPPSVLPSLRATSLRATVRPHPHARFLMHAFHARISCTGGQIMGNADVVPIPTSQPPDEMCVLAGRAFRFRTGLCVEYFSCALFHARFSCTHFMHRWPDLSDADVVPILTSQPPDEMCVLAGCTFRVCTGLCVKYPILPHSLVPSSSCELRPLHFQQTREAGILSDADTPETEEVACGVFYEVDCKRI